MRRSVGTWIRDRRHVLGVSQEGLRRRLAREGIRLAQATLSRWERGEVAPPLEVLPVLARSLATPLEAVHEMLELAYARSREDVDLTGKDPAGLLAAADNAATAGNLPRALDFLEVLADLFRLDESVLSVEDRGRVYLKLAWVHQHLWHLEAAAGALRRFGEIAGELPGELVFRGALQRFLLAQRHGDRLAAEGLARMIRDELANLPPELRAEACHALGSREYGEGRYDRAHSFLAEALASWERLRRPVEAARCRALDGYCLGRDGDPALGQELLVRAQSEASRLRALEVEIQARRLLGRLLAETGHAEEGLLEIENSVALARRAGLAAEEFISLWRAWEAAPAARRPEYEPRMRRLLRQVDPRLPEVRKFAATGRAGREEEEDER